MANGIVSASAIGFIALCIICILGIVVADSLSGQMLVQLQQQGGAPQPLTTKGEPEAPAEQKILEDDPKLTGQRSCPARLGPHVSKYESLNKVHTKEPIDLDKVGWSPVQSLAVAYPNQVRAETHTHLQASNPNGPGNYKHPSDMTLSQRHKFRRYAKFTKMNSSDYYNWLMLYRDQPQALELDQRQMLRRVLAGYKLTESDVPRDKPPRIPVSAKQQFDQAFPDHPTQLPMPETTKSDILAANYEQYDQFIAPKSLRHLEMVNQDQIKKKYGQEFLDWIRPEISTKQKHSVKQLE